MSEEILDMLDRLTDAYWSGDGNPELYSALEEKIKAVCAENERLRKIEAAARKFMFTEDLHEQDKACDELEELLK